MHNRNPHPHPHTHTTPPGEEEQLQRPTDRPSDPERAPRDVALENCSGTSSETHGDRSLVIGCQHQPIATGEATAPAQRSNGGDQRAKEGTSADPGSSCGREGRKEGGLGRFGQAVGSPPTKRHLRHHLLGVTFFPFCSSLSSSSLVTICLSSFFFLSFLLESIRMSLRGLPLVALVTKKKR